MQSRKGSRVSGVKNGKQNGSDMKPTSQLWRVDSRQHQNLMRRAHENRIANAEIFDARKYWIRDATFSSARNPPRNRECGNGVR
ncbi:hypothetical protein RRF57_009430 [Xylaria bambusicola]|uniref:Uncharacterized protein n=1 Tax=Xylaria bambusicola TaxID=326684 RepID=A0AAN7UWT3_9PEZI